nr:hypothetical protein [Tanacetum cinerariifolium]
MSISFIRSQASVRDSFSCWEKGSDFSKESIEKSWGKESSNESGSKFVPCFDSSFIKTGSLSDNTVGNPHGFIIHGIEVLKGNEKVKEVIDVENWCVDNYRLLRWIVSLFERNSSVLSTKSSIQ